MADQDKNDNKVTNYGTFVSYSLGDLSSATDQKSLVRDKDVFGNTVTKTAYWFAVQQKAVADYPKMAQVANGALLNEYVNKIVDGELNEGALLTLIAKYKVPLSSLGGGGGGGGGKSAEQRQFDIQSLAVTVSNESKKLGFQLDNDVIAYIATVAEKQGFSQEQLTSTLTGMTDWSTLQAGDLTTNVAKFKDVAKNYLVKIDDKTAQDWAVRIANGSISEDTVQSIIAQQAKTLNPWLTNTIDSGISPLDMLAASRNKISNSLGIDASTIDFTDNQYLKMVTFEDPKAGTRLATNNELQKNIRTDSRWGNSKEAKDLGTSMASTLGKIFGRNAF
jgi:hypothetical protein